jgi:hypothetical protein
MLVYSIGMNFKIFYIGNDIKSNARLECDLILLIIKKITGKKIEIVAKIDDADLTIVYPYFVSTFKFGSKATLLLKHFWCKARLCLNILGVKQDFCLNT